MNQNTNKNEKHNNFSHSRKLKTSSYKSYSRVRPNFSTPEGYTYLDSAQASVEVPKYLTYFSNLSDFPNKKKESNTHNAVKAIKRRLDFSEKNL